MIRPLDCLSAAKWVESLRLNMGSLDLSQTMALLRLTSGWNPPTKLMRERLLLSHHLDSLQTVIQTSHIEKIWVRVVSQASFGFAMTAQGILRGIGSAYEEAVLNID